MTTQDDWRAEANLICEQVGILSNLYMKMASSPIFSATLRNHLLKHAEMYEDVADEIRIKIKKPRLAASYMRDLRKFAAAVRGEGRRQLFWLEKFPGATSTIQ